MTAAVAASLEMRRLALPLQEEKIGRLEAVLSEARLAIARVESEFRTAMRDLVATSNLDKVVVALCSVFALRPEELLGPGRPNRVAWPRMIGMALLREAGVGARIAAAQLGRKDHGAALHAAKAVANRVAVDPKARTEVEAVRAELASLQ